MCVLRLADRGREKFWKDFKFFIITFLVGVVLMILCCFLFVHWIDGLIFLGAMLFFLYVAAQVWMYIQNDYYVKPLWAIVNQTLVVISVLFAFAWSIFDEELNSYQGGSFSALVLLFFIWTYAAINFLIDFGKWE